MPDDFDDEIIDDDDDPSNWTLGDHLQGSIDDIREHFALEGIELGDFVVAFGTLDDIDGLRGNVFTDPYEAYAYLSDAGLWDFSEIVYDSYDDVYYVYVGDSNGTTG